MDEDEWMDGLAGLRIASSNKKMVLTCLVICTLKEKIYSANCQSLIFCMYVLDGWMDGWMDGWLSRFKDCLQQSTKKV